MSTITETVEILAPAGRVFGYVEDIRNVGWHTSSSSLVAACSASWRTSRQGTEAT
jgi:hypothetical protein